MKVAAVLLAVGAVHGWDKNIILKPPNPGAPKKALFVFVPGGLVPNSQYVPLLQTVQQKLAGSVDLWVSITACQWTGKLCLPVVSSLEVKAALDEGVKQSGAIPAETWMGGHSLGAVEADTFIVADNGKRIAGGSMLWGSYVTKGIDKMLSYPVPVMQLLAELDYGSARVPKMAPYYAAAEAGGAAQLQRTPVVVIADLDHSDFCRGFNVSGDLPSALSAAEAHARIADLSAAFLLQQIVGDANAAQTLADQLAFTKTLMDPVNAALALEQSGAWCAQVMSQIVAGPYNDSVSVTYSEPSGDWTAPTAQRTASGSVAAAVTGHNQYVASWPPGQKTRMAGALGLIKPPDPKRNTAESLGCRMVSRVRVGALLNQSAAAEPQNLCEQANRMAWEYAQRNAPPHVMKRYQSASPCNGCARGVPVVFAPDSDAGGDFQKSKLGYDLSPKELGITGAAHVDAAEHSCWLLSPARALDFLMLDAYSGSIYTKSG
eukprot:TRINITY_DN333_c0_g1_i1.p1 TRINITY_DN333_c0_g1~~TRINITY_DN333_c0_g1_i1.p1  ORF type:complete len:515 (+),score=155.88 TRINITY_DN333_c0_g1_i1:79-1545(+)